MNCPYCGKEMVDGVAQSGREIFFTTKQRDGWKGFKPHTGDTSLSWHNFTRPTCVAYHCVDCKKVILDYTIEVE